MLSRAKSLIGQSAVYGLGNILTQGVAFLLLPLYTQYLTTADYGVLSAVTALNSVLASILPLGLQGAIARLHFDYMDDEEGRRAYYGTMWLTLTVIGLAVTLLLQWQGNLFFRLVFRNVPFYPYGQLTIWQVFFTQLSLATLALLRMREQARNFTLLTVGRFLLSTAGIIFFVAVRREGAVGSLKGQLFASIVMAIPFTWIMVRNMRLSLLWDKLKESLAFSLPIVPHQVAGWALQVSDRVLLERYRSLAEVGVYSLGYRFGMILDLVLSSFNLAWAPFYFRVAATEEDAPRTFARLTTYITAGMLFMSLGLTLLARDVIDLIAKPSYYDAYKVVPAVVLAFLAHGYYFLVVNQLFYAKKTARLPIYTGVSAGLNVGLNVLLLQRFGMMAAAWTTMVGYTLLLVLVFIDSNRVYPVPYEYRRLASMAALAVVLFVVGSLVRLENLYLDFAAHLLVACLFPVALFALRFFSSREIEGMKLLLQRILQRPLRPERSA